MASPLAHTIIAYAIHKLLRPAEESHTGCNNRPNLLQSIVLSNLPDVDALLGLLFRDVRRYHNNITHSIFTGLAVSLLAAMLPRPAAIHTFIHYTLHLLTDLLSQNKRGLMLFAPFSTRRYRIPITLFYGFRWGLGLFSSTHLWTLATELLFALFVLLALKITRKVSTIK